MYVPYRQMPERLKARKPIEGNSVTAHTMPSGGYRVVSFKTIMLEIDANGEPVYYDPGFYSITTNKIQWLIAQEFHPLEWIVQSRPARVIHGPITGLSCRIYRWRARLGVRILQVYDEPSKTMLFAIALRSGLLITQAGFDPRRANVYSCRSMHDAQNLGEVLLNAATV